MLYPGASISHTDALAVVNAFRLSAHLSDRKTLKLLHVLRILLPTGTAIPRSINILNSASGSSSIILKGNKIDSDTSIFGLRNQIEDVIKSTHLC